MVSNRVCKFIHVLAMNFNAFACLLTFVILAHGQLSYHLSLLICPSHTPLSQNASVRNVWRAPFRSLNSLILQQLKIRYVSHGASDNCARTDNLRNVWRAACQFYCGVLTSSIFRPSTRHGPRGQVWSKCDYEFVPKQLLLAHVAIARRCPTAVATLFAWLALSGFAWPRLACAGAACHVCVRQLAARPSRRSKDLLLSHPTFHSTAHVACYTYAVCSSPPLGVRTTWCHGREGCPPQRCAAQPRGAGL